MRRNITATTKCAQDFIFFCMAQKTHKKIFSQELKVKTKVQASLFGFYIAIEKFWKKNYSQVGAVERDFPKPRIFQFWVQILEIW